MTSKPTGPLIVSVLKDALVKFGSITEHNREQVTRWVRRRCDELADDQPVPDAKARAAGEPERVA